MSPRLIPSKNGQPEKAIPDEAESLQALADEIGALSKSVEKLFAEIRNRPEPKSDRQDILQISQKLGAATMLLDAQQKLLLKISKAISELKTDWEFIPERSPRGFVERWIARRLGR